MKVLGSSVGVIVMTTNDQKKTLEIKKFKRKHRKVKYNPIRPIKYPDSKRSCLRDESCRSNVIGKENGIILGMFCYDAK